MNDTTKFAEDFIAQICKEPLLHGDADHRAWLKAELEKHIPKLADMAEELMDVEFGRWQERIYNICKEAYPEVDGGGCDSGDPLDFSAAEIEQTLAHVSGDERT